MQSTKWELYEYQRSRSFIDLGPNHSDSLFLGERGGSVVECRTREREVRGSRPTAAVLCPWARHFTPRKYWLITQEAMAPSRYDWKIVDWDVKPQHNQPIIIFTGWLDWAMVLGSFQCRGLLLLLHIVGQDPAVLATGVGRVGYIFHLSSLSNFLSFGRLQNMSVVVKPQQSFSVTDDDIFA